MVIASYAIFLLWMAPADTPGMLPAAPAAAAVSVSESGDEVLSRYLQAIPNSVLRGVEMEVDIRAKLVKLRKEGTLHAMRSISRVGEVTYSALKWAGDNTIKKDVITRFLSAEVQARQEKSNLGLTPENYKFKYKGMATREGLIVHVFQVTPKRKVEGLFKGELWVDPDTYLPLRESGQLVKTPSVFLKKVEFVRDYEIREGVAVPVRLLSQVDTRVVGRAELDIRFSNVRKDGPAVAQLSPSDIVN